MDLETVRLLLQAKHDFILMNLNNKDVQIKEEVVDNTIDTPSNQNDNTVQQQSESEEDNVSDNASLDQNNDNIQQKETEEDNEQDSEPIIWL